MNTNERPPHPLAMITAEKAVMAIRNYDNMDFNDEEREEHESDVRKVAIIITRICFIHPPQP